ncbi:hypothetical protein [Caulobacter segnis]|uniref:Uncharacterized protein n=1 Tax=Caulobacter segnis TaxID=88688 RepID=A0A2W5VB45_9CAUL|nr:hypothetical protein [Caulobacter segnis]PZR36492.1 MAG: hypothetical protein DI526_03385 [Caulobacter segnis]
MGARQQDGAPLRDHLEMMSRGHDQQAADARHRLANPPPLPELAAHIWRYYVEPATGLAATRPVNGMALSPISRLEIAQWERDEMVRLEAWERRALLRLDHEYRTANAPAGSSKAGGDGQPVEEA